MRARVVGLARALLPQRVVDTARDLVRNLPRAGEVAPTRRALAAAPTEPAFLDAAALETMQAQYPTAPEYGYDPASVEHRGRIRAREILRLPGARGATDFLELGCWDGMVAAGLTRAGKRAAGVDRRADGFDARAGAAGARLLAMNASQLEFEDGSFDFVYSYDAFEHFDAPERVMAECIRVLRPGGRLHLEFGPLFLSPLGQHAYRSIRVPYCQCLFTPATMTAFAALRGLPAIDFDHVNRWPIARFRALWASQAASLERVRYRETLDLSHLALIRQYPSCFRSKSEAFEDFVVAQVSALFEKRG
ncbi:MAG: class I SAM-dependent methyltransferase [Candidatus Eisenbacteria bacterium]